VKRKRTIRPEERALWKTVAMSVTPLSEDRIKALDDPEPPAPSAPSPPTKAERMRSTRGVDTAPAPAAPDRPSGPHDRSGEKRMRRGRVEVDARIDLHGLTQDQALSSLRHFLAMAHAGGYRTVLVITGKGLKRRERDAEPWDYPDEPGVLRRKLPEWLSLPEFREYVSGYAPAHIRHGGSGAFYVTLRAPVLRE
jgi:DNA-nicking Smr family endonuclease